jgi:hypothetical protein
MKKVVFIGRENGYITPERQADFLSKHAHLEGIIGMVKYYTFRGQGFKVIYVAGNVAQINKMDADEIKRIVSCAKLEFGGF